ncbi:MAG: hypothetical protein EAX91_05550 [Candidatus Lokiarchaeota archaeon]|nr:hypothetical protein [Candidatus Lokiarchaeota archaeon]
MADKKELKKRRENLKNKIILRMKKRSKKKNILNEIANDLEKTELKPEDLILLDYIDKKLSDSKK